MDENEVELSGRQRLELAMLEDDADAAAREPDRSKYVGALATIARYARAEGLTLEAFDRSGDSMNLNRCYTATGIAQHPSGFLESSGCMGATVLFAAGFAPPGNLDGTLTTREEGRSRLRRDGWVYAGVDERFHAADAPDAVEIWTRGEGDARQWCEMFRVDGFPGVAPDASWARFAHPEDPRLVSAE